MMKPYIVVVRYLLFFVFIGLLMSSTYSLTLKASKNKSDYILIEWTSRSNYTLYRKKKYSKKFNKILNIRNDVKNLRHSKGIQAGIVYQFYLQNNRIKSNTATGMIPSFAYHFSPTPYHYSNNGNQLFLSWNALTDAISYEVQIVNKNFQAWTANDGFRNKSDIIFSTETDKNELVIPITDNIDYAWTVRAIFKNRKKSKFSDVSIIEASSEEIVAAGASPIILNNIAIDTSTYQNYTSVHLKFDIEYTRNRIRKPKIIYCLSTDNQYSLDDIMLAEDKLLRQEDFNVERFLLIKNTIQKGNYYILAIPEVDNVKQISDGMKFIEIQLE